MKFMSLAVTSIAAFALSTGLAAAQMQPIPNPPEHPHHHRGWDYHHGHHHHRGHHGHRHGHHHGGHDHDGDHHDTGH